MTKNAQTPRATVNKDPFGVVLDLPGLKDGIYKIEGEASAENWQKVCETAAVPNKGSGKATLKLDIAGPVIRVTGTIDVTIEQECVRTLEAFMSEQHFDVTETLARKTPKDQIDKDSDAFVIEGDAFDVGDFLTQHIILNLDPYPIKDPKGRTLRGGVMVSDGLDETIKEEKNPFSVLKQLKS